MQDAVVETVVTHTRRTTTSFAPIPLPRIPIPESVPMPSHLTWEEGYPLAAEPTPDELKFIELKLGDRKVIVQEDGHVLPADQVLRKTLSGPGWTRELSSVATEPERVEHIDHAVEMGFMQYITAKGKEKETGGNKRPHDPSTPMPVDSATMRPRSPPRKKIRPSEGMMMDDGVPVSPPSSPDDESMFKAESPQIALLTHFEKLPDKVQQHVLMHMFRRSRMPTIQAISAFASTALKRDFITLLPHEIAVQVLKKLDVKSLSVAANVSKAWRKKIDQERSVWRTRLVEDGLWYGHGVEDEEEQSIRRRYEALDRRGGKRRVSKAGTPSEDEPMSVDRPAMFERSSPVQQLERATPPSSTFTEGGSPAIATGSMRRRSTRRLPATAPTSSPPGRARGRRVWALEYKGDTLVSGSTDRTVRIWDLEDLVQTHTFAGHTSTVRCLQIVEPVYDEVTGEFQPPYPLIITGLLPPPDENPFHVHHLEGHGEAVRALAAHGRICVSGSYDKTVRVWDIVKGTCIHVLHGHEAKVYSIVYDKYRNRCASGSMDNTVKIWDLATGKCLHTLTGHTSLVGLLGLSPNRIVSAAADASLRVWDANTYELQHTLSSHAAAITCFQHDETKVVSGSDGTLKLWDIKTGRFICDLITGISSVWQVAFYGNLLVAASNRNGNTVFDVFDFGKKSEVDHSGIDDDKLDLLRRAPWERGNPHEPQTYQVEDEGGDDEDVFCVGTEDALSPKTHEKWRAMSVRSQRPVRRGRSRVASSGPGDGQGSKRAFRLGVAFGDRGREGDRLSTREVGDRLSRVRSEPGATRTRVGPWTQTQMFQSAEASGSGSASGSGTASGSGAASAPGEGEDEGEGELGLLDVDVNMGREVE
ncbi:hypothetical protein CcaverHIS002_0107750 [Cutaneotrichosporon cavernicola]|nr:hypothetical protein CcaverHIS002_0107750 [Cutaneotrichosporon cavernicola]